MASWQQWKYDHAVIWNLISDRKKIHLRLSTIRPQKKLHHIAQWLTGALVPDRAGCDSLLPLASHEALDKLQCHIVLCYKMKIIMVLTWYGFYVKCTVQCQDHSRQWINITVITVVLLSLCSRPSIPKPSSSISFIIFWNSDF